MNVRVIPPTWSIARRLTLLYSLSLFLLLGIAAAFLGLGPHNRHETGQQSVCRGRDSEPPRADEATAGGSAGVAGGGGEGGRINSGSHPLLREDTG